MIIDHWLMRVLAAAVIACSVIAASPMAQMTGLNADEQALVAFVDTHNAGALTLLERVVNINSGTQNHAGVREVGKVFRQELDALGFKTQWVDGTPFKRAGHLVAEHAGPGPKILLIGHLDTVFEADSPFQKFEKIDETHARGPGIIDMKGGNVILVQALKALASTGTLKKMNVTVVMTGDEEDAGEPLADARKALVDAAKGAAYAIGFEDGPGDPKTAVVSRRGTSAWTLRVKGQPAHSSQIFRKDIGSGAIFEAGKDSERLPREDGGRAAPHFQSGRDCRWDIGRLRHGAGAWHGVRQDQRDRRACHRVRRPPHALAGAACEGEKDDGGDRRRVHAARAEFHHL